MSEVIDQRTCLSHINIHTLQASQQLSWGGGGGGGANTKDWNRTVDTFYVL